MKKVIYLQFTNPGIYPPLIHSSRFFLNAGWKVLFLGILSHGESCTLAMPERKGCEVQLLRWVDPGIRQKIHYLRYMLWSLLICLRQRPDAVYCSDPLAVLPGIILKKMGFYVIYHEHDSPLSGERNGLPALVNWGRRQLLRDASLVVFPNKKRLELVINSAQSNVSTKVSWNCPTLDELPVLPFKSSVPMVIYYHGTFSPDRIPILLFNALAKLKGSVILKIIGYETVGSIGYRRILLDRAVSLGIAKYVEIESEPKSLRSEIFEAAKNCHVGLSFMPKKSNDINMIHMTGASNKIFDYMACGMVSLVSDLPDWREMFVHPGYALACDPDDADSIAEQLKYFLDHPAQREEMGKIARKKIESDWNYEKQFEPVFREIKRN